MARFIKGDVVIVPFPFSDLTQSKRRPALVISNLIKKHTILDYKSSFKAQYLFMK